MFKLRISLEECILKNIFGRNLIKRSDVFVIFLTLSLIFTSYFLIFNSSEKKTVAVITVDGKMEKEIDLTLQENCIITLKTDPVVTLEVKDHKIRFIDSDCPDGTCEKMGFLSNQGQTAACIPAKVIVTINGTDGASVDAVVG
ncbi:MAG: NusG domain II-containing protein [Acutalibacteraceae bacterium]|nr:NusG domain II-containing protein [Acutalibacteraceae bacterium]